MNKHGIGCKFGLLGEGGGGGLVGDTTGSGHINRGGQCIGVLGHEKGVSQLKWREVAYTFNKREDWSIPGRRREELSMRAPEQPSLDWAGKG